MIPDSYFDQFATPKYRGRNPLQRLLLRRFLQRLQSLFVEADPKRSVVEIGVGEGFLSGYLSEVYGDKTFTGVDIRRQDLDLLRRHFPRIEAHQGDIYDLSFLEAPYELVICAEVLEHLDEPEKALDQILGLEPRRVTRGVCC